MLIDLFGDCCNHLSEILVYRSKLEKFSIMDKYKITFVCKQRPASDSGLNGFSPNKQYEGRTYNGLFEISSKWGSGVDSKIISKKLFDRYFDLIENRELVKHSA